MQINIINAAAFAYYNLKKNYQIFAISLRDIEKIFNNRSYSDSATLLPEYYHDFLDVFSRVESNKLSLHRSYDYDISLMPDIEPPAELLHIYFQEDLRVI